MPKVFRFPRHSTRAPLLALALGLTGCGHERGEVGRPEATLSARADAQSTFRPLRAAWFSGSTLERRRLEPELRSFLARFPADEQSDMVRVLLAFDCVSRGALLEARVLVAQVREHVGSVRDFSRVATAYALLRESKTDTAWAVLEPLAGKIIDSDERLVFSELRLRVATSARHFGRAVKAAEELLAEAPVETQSSLEATVRELFRPAPKAELVSILTSLEHDVKDDSATSQAREWLRKMLRERLVAIAVREKDAALARSLLDSAPAALRASESGSALVGIAGDGQGLPSIVGRSVGVALSLGDPELRRRSANLVAGLAHGLGLPDALSQPGAVRLVSQDDAGASAGTNEALRELSAEGATIMIAGFDGASADIAARFAEENAIPVLLVQEPETLAGPFQFAYVLGEGSHAEQAAIDVELSRRGLQRIARVGRLGEGCDAPLLNAGGARFAVQQWRAARVSALLVLGSAGCASDVARELRSVSFAPELALGLEAAEFVYASDAPRARFAVGAGRFPSAVRPDSADNPALPALDWYEALGHDAAQLARAALEGFPEGRVADARAVRELHARAERALASAQASLWTSDARGFSRGHVLPRTLTIVSPARPAANTGSAR